MRLIRRRIVPVILFVVVASTTNADNQYLRRKQQRDNAGGVERRRYLQAEDSANPDNDNDDNNDNESSISYSENDFMVPPPGSNLPPNTVINLEPKCGCSPSTISFAFNLDGVCVDPSTSTEHSSTTTTDSSSRSSTSSKFIRPNLGIDQAICQTVPIIAPLSTTGNGIDIEEEGSSSGTLLTPVVIDSVQIIELDINDRIVGTTNMDIPSSNEESETGGSSTTGVAATRPTFMSSTATVEFESSISIDDSMNIVPSTLQLNIRGRSLTGQIVQQFVTIRYSNACQVSPVLKSGQELGWIRIVNVGPTVDDKCTPSPPTYVPTSSPAVDNIDDNPQGGGGGGTNENNKGASTTSTSSPSNNVDSSSSSSSASPIDDGDSSSSSSSTNISDSDKNNNDSQDHLSLTSPPSQTPTGSNAWIMEDDFGSGNNNNKKNGDDDNEADSTSSSSNSSNSLNDVTVSRMEDGETQNDELNDTLNDSVSGNSYGPYSVQYGTGYSGSYDENYYINYYSGYRSNYGTAIGGSTTTTSSRLDDNHSTTVVVAAEGDDGDMSNENEFGSSETTSSNFGTTEVVIRSEMILNAQVIQNVCGNVLTLSPNSKMSCSWQSTDDDEDKDLNSETVIGDVQTGCRVVKIESLERSDDGEDATSVERTDNDNNDGEKDRSRIGTTTANFVSPPYSKLTISCEGATNPQCFIHHDRSEATCTVELDPTIVGGPPVEEVSEEDTTTTVSHPSDDVDSISSSSSTPTVKSPGVIRRLDEKGESTSYHKYVATTVMNGGIQVRDIDHHPRLRVVEHRQRQRLRRHGG